MALIPDIATKTVVVEHEKKSIITIGGTDPAKFVPNINCSFERVDKDEFYLNINAKSVVVTDEKETLSEITEIKINDRTDRYYIDDDGNLEYEIIFDQKPKSNIIELSLEYSKEVYFAYQGVLTQEDIERGAMRPENVENSYAVKCGKRNNLYKTGKLLHIYRSFVIDAKGKKSWCIQEIQDSIWKITIPEAVFNDDSLYPLKVGPTLGYTALDGASSEAVSNALTYAFSVGTMTEDGTLDSIHIGDVDTTVVDGCYAALYDDDTGNPGSPIFLTTEQTRGSGPQFIDVTAGDENLSNGESYWIAVHTANVSRIAVPYDSDTGNPGLKWDVGSYTYGSFHDPWDNNGTAADREYGIYITYTVGGGSTLLPTDLINMSDSITLNIKINKSDNVTLSDSIIKSPGLNKSDSISLSDNISNVVSFVRSISDTINLTDELLKSVEIVLSDTINLSDNFNAIITLILSLNDSITMSDSILKTPNINKSDAINISDEIIKSFGLSETDTINLTDVISKSIATTRSDTINMSDNFNSLITLILALNDTINMSDSILKEIDIVKSDTINLSDEIIKSFGLTKSDIINLTDVFSTTADVIYALLNFVAENKTFNFIAKNKTFNFIAKTRGTE